MATVAADGPARRGRSAGFGSIEKLPSGRLRVRWHDEDGQRRTAGQTFATKADARRFLATVEADKLRGTYRAPRVVTDTLGAYGARWIEDRPRLKASTRHQYEVDFRLHIEPALGSTVLDQIEPDDVGRWYSRLSDGLRASLAESGRDGSATVARSYRLLRAILQTAVDDDILTRNPCRIPGAGDARSPERPVLSAQEIGRLADEVPVSYRAFVLVAGFTGLRAGEIAALRLSDLDLRRGSAVLRVNRRFYRVAGTLTVDTPKSEAGARTLPLPAFVADELRAHLAEFRPAVEQVVRLRTGQWAGDTLLQVVLGHDGRLLVSRDQGNVVWSPERGAPSSMARVVPLAEAASRARQPAGREDRDGAARHHPVADRSMRPTTSLSPLLSLHQEVCSRAGGVLPWGWPWPGHRRRRAVTWPCATYSTDSRGHSRTATGRRTRQRRRCEVVTLRRRRQHRVARRTPLVTARRQPLRGS